MIETARAFGSWEYAGWSNSVMMGVSATISVQNLVQKRGEPAIVYGERWSKQQGRAFGSWERFSIHGTYLLNVLPCWITFRFCLLSVLLCWLEIYCIKKKNQCRNVDESKQFLNPNPDCPITSPKKNLTFDERAFYHCKLFFFACLVDGWWRKFCD